MRRGVERRPLAARNGLGQIASRLAAILICLVALAAEAALAQSAYEVEEEPPLSLRALVDLRLVRPGRAPSWANRGPSKTRYGGERNDAGGFEHVTRFALSQLGGKPDGCGGLAQGGWPG